MPESLTRIVLVDDTKDDLILASRVLRQCKLLNPVSLFRGGKECIDYIQSQASDSDSQPETSILFLDLVMAQISGLDVLRFLQSHEYAKHCIPIMLSGLKEIKAINEGYHLGAKTFLLKPITPFDLVQFLNSLPNQITIEERAEGYALHWTERLNSETEIFHKTQRIVTFPA